MPSKTIDEWSVSMLTGGVPVNFPYSASSASVFSEDGRYLITTLSHQIRVYFISTRQCIRTIDIDLSELADVKLDVTNPNHVVLFKSSGEIIVVNYKDKLIDPVISRTSIQQQLETLSVLSVVSVKHDKYVVVTGKALDKKKKGHGPHTRHLISVDRTADSVSHIVEIQNVLNYAVSLDTSKIAFVTADQSILLLDLEIFYSNSLDDVEPLSLTSAKNWEELIVSEVIPFQYRSPITCAAVSNDSIVALGTNSGVIQIVYGGSSENNSDSTTQRLLKWHFDQVNALYFTSDNNYLLSGGSEKVLVFWQLETEKKQFLPRLNGPIDKIAIDAHKNDYISLLLKTDVGNYEILLLSLVDLVSRLAVNTIRPKFANILKTTLSRTKKRYAKDASFRKEFNKLKLKYDYTCAFEIHSKTKNLYFPNESSIQAYDIIRNEQSFVQHAAPTISTGKVRGEQKIADPQIVLLKFSKDGEWMCTYDEVADSEIDSLMSKKDKQHALKFWKFNESKDKENKDNKDNKDSRNGFWELTSIIMDPHGKGTPVLSLIAAPTSYFNGVAFLTADNRGGLRVWRPTFPKEAYKVNTASTPNKQNKSQQIAWTLRKQKPASSSNSTFDAVSLAWSDDSSTIFMSHECSIDCVDSKTFDLVPDFQIPTLTESKIRAIHFLNNHLVVLSKTRFFVYDLIAAQLTDLVTKVHTTSGAKQLITVDAKRNLIGLAINFYENFEPSEADNLSIASKLYIFKPDQAKPIFVKEHDSGIASLRTDSKSFIFVDLECRAGSITSTLLEDVHDFRDVAGDDDDEEKKTGSLTDEIKSMLISAQGNVDLMNYKTDAGNMRPKQQQQNGSTEEDFEAAMSTSEKVVGLHTFQSVFQNLNGLQVDTIFDRITDILK
ncbi:uncharacterized protein LODBEIA_P50250 [Lodderomyces beijingensis]|uniref:NET1-associated nuclear protein 1 n=1 Tax=Lodderomyces beijingensis TaxID=1775926 RepID=A0ABP0ZUY2_9ASCO